jgi:MFS family permease
MIDITKSRSSKYLLFGSIYFIQGLLLAMGQLIIPVYLVEKSFPAPLITLIVGVIMVPWTIKFFWGALIDYLIRFGRRIFALLGGILFAAGLFAVAFIDPAKSLVLFVFFFFVSVSGLVLQDVAIDAWAIEVSHEKE